MSQSERPISLKVRGSRSGRPIMLVLDLLGRRWTLRIVWELRDRAATFRDLRERCESVSPSVLNRRLSELREVGIVEHRDHEGYCLTPGGQALIQALAPLNQWASKWLSAPGRVMD